MIFKRRKNADDGDARIAADAAGDTPAADAPEADTPAADDGVVPGDAGAPADAGAAPHVPVTGPFDIDDAPDREGYIDLGALLVEPVEGMQLRLEVEENSQRVVAAALELDGSRLQLQVFAAPKTGGLWPGIAEQISDSIAEQGGRIDRVAGRFGEELVARVPSTGPDGTEGYMVARFIGIDGPRWFLRGVVGGPATLDRAQAERLEDRLARVVVVRGDQPMPPQELLPLTMPAGAVTRPDRHQHQHDESMQLDQQDASGQDEPGQTDPAGEAAQADGGTGDGAGEQRLRRPERGPEITEIG